jgi:hypothetical protein
MSLSKSDPGNLTKKLAIDQTRLKQQLANGSNGGLDLKITHQFSGAQ